MTAIDPHAAHHFGVLGVGDDAYVITPDDDSELPIIPREIYVGSAGNVRVETVKGTELTVFIPFDGMAFPSFRVRKVFDNGTTAANMIAIP